MAKRVLLAGVLGGLAMFLWGSIAHIVLDLGSIGIEDIPHEQAILPAMQANLPQAGFYFFPGLGVGRGAPRAERDAAMARYGQKIASGPSGILIYHPSGRSALTPGQLLTEFGTNLAQGILAAILLSFATGLASYGSRVAFVTIAGLLAGITTNISYWNWYGFPGSYTTAYIFIQVMGYVSIGLVAAAIVKPKASGARAAQAGA